MSTEVTLIRGDGIGPEVVEASVRVLEATGVNLTWDEQPAGAEEHERSGDALPQTTLDSAKRTGLVLKGPTGTPIGTGFRSINVALRKELDLFACIRPCVALPGMEVKFPETDLVIVRENLEDVYAGIEYERGTDKFKVVREAIERVSPHVKVRDDSGITIKLISTYESKRLLRKAFELAREQGRRLTVGHKANIMKHTDGIFLDAAQELTLEYPDVQMQDLIIDNLCQRLIIGTWDNDVIALPNLYGDIISDLAAGMVGGLGIAPGANIGPRHAVFEATHGSAPDIAGQGKANPIALILSAALLLDHIGEERAGDRVRTAVSAVTAEGSHLTGDIARSGQVAASTSQVADAIIDRL